MIDKYNTTHGNKYEYDISSIKNATKKRSKIRIKCPIHGYFLQRKDLHAEGGGCYHCGRANANTKNSNTFEDFVRCATLTHNGKYDYSKVVYINSRSKVVIICPVHGDFTQAPKDHVYGRGCPGCRSSKGETEVSKFLRENKIDYKQEYRFCDCKNVHQLPFDFYISSLRVAIEYQGIQHYKPCWGDKCLYRTQHTDTIKKKYCLDNNIKLIEIKYNEDVYEVLSRYLLNNATG